MNFSCICGHEEKFHNGLFPVEKFNCIACIEDLSIPYLEVCRKYKADNLKYLEKRYEESLKNG